MQLVMKAVPNGISTPETGILSTSIADPQHPGKTIDCTNLARAMIKAGLLADWQGNCQNHKYYITISGEDVIVDFSTSQPDGFDEAAAMEILSMAQIWLNTTLREALRLQGLLRSLHRTGDLNFILTPFVDTVKTVREENATLNTAIRTVTIETDRRLNQCESSLARHVERFDHYTERIAEKLDSLTSRVTDLETEDTEQERPCQTKWWFGLGMCVVKLCDQLLGLGIRLEKGILRRLEPARPN